MEKLLNSLDLELIELKDEIEREEERARREYIATEDVMNELHKLIRNLPDYL